MDLRSVCADSHSMHMSQKFFQERYVSRQVVLARSYHYQTFSEIAAEVSLNVLMYCSPSLDVDANPNFVLI